MRRSLRKGSLLVAAVAGGLLTLTSAQGGVFPGDNGRIAFTCGPNICTVNPDGSGLNAAFLTSSSDLSWSSDQSEIAYVTGGTINVANEDTTFPGSIGAASGSAQPTLSADGNTVVYARGGNIYASFSFGGGESALTTAGTDADPAYSPDGSKIAFARNDGATGYDIWTMTSSGGSLHQVTNAIGDERSPTWSPSGLSIVYSAGPTHELFGASSSTSSVPTPTDLTVPGTDPAFSPDGKKIAFINSSGHLAVMTNTATPVVTVLESTLTDSQPDWEAAQSSSGGPPTSFTGPPVNISYPTVNLTFGDTTPTLGDFLTASVGTWNGASPFTYAYQWKRCDPADPVNGQCIDIAGARSSFYTPVPADYGQRLRVQVTATNSQGTASQNSEVTVPVTADAPVLRVTPQIFGENTVDETLSVTAGTWDGSSPLVFTYSWRRCNPPGDLASCVPIPGATTSTYTATTADIGFTLRVWITGTNVAGTDVGITNHTYPVVDKQHFSPSTIDAPAVVGTVEIGRQLTGSIGTFDGDTPISTSFVWQRCDATGGACHTIAGATKVVYYPSAVDLGSTLRLSVTATNAYGTLVSMSDPTEPVLASPPHRKGRRIVGTDKGEYLAGGGFDDTIFGMGGNDTILGGAGDDHLYGGAGNDVITGGSGSDTIFGGSGSDTIYAADGERDVIDCGPGRDRAVVDAVDIVKNCEVVVVTTPDNSSSPGTGTSPTPTPIPIPTPTDPGTGR